MTMIEQTLYRVYVDTRETENVAVGPALLKEHALAYCQAITDQIKSGAEKSWGNPRIALCH